MFKKITATVLAVAMSVTIMAVPAKADNSEEVIIGILGGALGGLIIGGIVRDHRHSSPVRVYEYEEPVVVRECVTKYKRYYDSMGNWVRRPVKKCYWVERY